MNVDLRFRILPGLLLLGGSLAFWLVEPAWDWFLFGAIGGLFCLLIGLLFQSRRPVVLGWLALLLFSAATFVQWLFRTALH